MGPKADRKATTNAKHWCEFCRTFVYNNKISRDKHDNSDWHRDNVQKFIDRQQREEVQKQRLLGKFTAATGVKLGKMATVTSTPKASFYNQVVEGNKKEEPIDLVTMQRKRTISQVDDLPTVEEIQAQTATVGTWTSTSDQKKPIVTPLQLGPVKSGKGKLSISLLPKNDEKPLI